MNFAEELDRFLPADLPRRELVIVEAAKHLNLIVEANQHFNLTRITAPREAAIKHVFDCVAPWRLFSGFTQVLDAGSGAGFPGIPLALVLPDARFTLSESIQKKARFLKSAVEALGLANVEVTDQRAEEFVRMHSVDVITGRAVAPLSRAAALFGPAIRAGAHALFYKGPDAETEILEMAAESARRNVLARVVHSYELPESMGTRTIVEMKAGVRHA